MIHLTELETPCLILDCDRLERNLERMREHCRRNPHVHIVFRDRDTDTNRRVIGTSASTRELKQARLGGRARPPIATAEALRLAWREHLANFYADRAVAADTGALLSTYPSPSALRGPSAVLRLLPDR